MSRLLGHDAATLCLAIANRHVKESNPDYKPMMAHLLKSALDANLAQGPSEVVHIESQSIEGRTRQGRFDDNPDR